MYDRQAFIATSYEVLDRSYTPLDLIDMDFEIEICFPGEYTFRRGIQASMYRV
ncbi:MAG: hypothetical protein KGY39_06855 [Anaerolineales bacterium]|nr:hypothetical protein [Anaerolineales bacterium]MBS3752521.1 hypothetical protein [Anaerolineales bacterium]